MCLIVSEVPSPLPEIDIADEPVLRTSRRARGLALGMMASGLFHFGALAGVVAWTAWSITPPSAPGQRNVVSLNAANSRASIYSPPSELPLDEAAPAEAPVYVAPRESEVDKRSAAHDVTTAGQLESHLAALAQSPQAELPLPAPSQKREVETPADAPRVPTKADVKPREVSRPPSMPSTASLARVSVVGTDDSLPADGIRNLPPIYPDEAARRKIEGKVTLRILVTREGKVGDLEVFRSSGHALLDEAAADAVKLWRYRPAKRGREAFDFVMRVEVVFTTKQE